MDTVKPNGFKQRRLTHSIIDSMRTTLEHVSVCLIRLVEHHMLFRVARDINNNNTVRMSSACMMKHLSNAIVESMLPVKVNKMTLLNARNQFLLICYATTAMKIKL